MVQGKDKNRGFSVFEILCPKISGDLCPKMCPKTKKITKKAHKIGLNLRKINTKLSKKQRKMLISVRNEHFLVDDQGLEPWAH